MRRRIKRAGSVYRPYQGRRRGGGGILLAVLAALAVLALAVWLCRDSLPGLLGQLAER